MQMYYVLAINEYEMSVSTDSLKINLIGFESPIKSPFYIRSN